MCRMVTNSVRTSAKKALRIIQTFLSSRFSFLKHDLGQDLGQENHDPTFDPLYEIYDLMRKGTE